MTIQDYLERRLDCWHLGIELEAVEIHMGRWISEEWKIKQLWPSLAGHQANKNGNKTHNGIGLTTFLDLTLYRDERTAYRFNLSSVVPHLFILCDEDEENDIWTPSEITACQDVAASWLDGEHKVLETPMPEAVQCWMETFMAEHGELVEEMKKRRYAEGDKKGSSKRKKQEFL